jgi:hypothetical protein
MEGGVFPEVVPELPPDGMEGGVFPEVVPELSPDGMEGGVLPEVVPELSPDGAPMPPEDIVPMFSVTVLPSTAVTWPYLTLLSSDEEDSVEAESAEAVPDAAEDVPHPAADTAISAAAERTAIIFLHDFNFFIFTSRAYQPIFPC